MTLVLFALIALICGFSVGRMIRKSREKKVLDKYYLGHIPQDERVDLQKAILRSKFRGKK